LQKIASADERRGKDVLSFFKDLSKCFTNISGLLRLRGHMIIVIGNRRVKRVTIPTDIIITELCSAIGYDHLKTIIREIPTKRMPRINSPTNEPGVTEETMNREYIIILRKERS